jgi:hypothetical protein
MTLRANARVAGFMFLFYIATAYPALVLSNRAEGTGDAAAKLASIARHGDLVGITAILTFVAFIDAIVLAVALYGLTRDEDNELAVMALCCRVAEGVINAVGAIATVVLLAAARMSVATSPDAAAAKVAGALLLDYAKWSTTVSADCFAVGSTIFAFLFLRARSIPRWLAWVGFIGSALLVIGLSLQLGGFLRGALTNLMWIPVGVFEVVLGFWLLIKGVAARPIGKSAA